MNFVLKKCDLEKFLGELNRDFDVFVPVKRNKNYFYRKFKSGMKLNLTDYQNTLYSPKKFFYPITENMFNYSKGKFKTNLEKSKRRKVVFGIRPCDMNGILVLNKVFDEFYQDIYQLESRKDVISIVVNCNQAGEYCFCGSFGTNIIKEGFDLLMNEEGNFYIVQSGSKIGDKIITRNRDIFTKTGRELKTSKMEFKRKIESGNIIYLLNNNFQHPIWEKEAEKCLSCAACTITCPTCHCFDVRDEVNLKDGSIDRIRSWDSCQIKDFTRIFGNVDIRGDRASRLKHRIFCKLVYFMERYGVFGCIGCGRCIESCLTKIDMTEIINKIGGNTK